ncbi:hypothetical protein AB0E57_13065, partial [Micrococcus luteus]
ETFLITVHSERRSVMTGMMQTAYLSDRASASKAGAEMLGISLVTNLAAGITDTSLSQAEVMEAGKAATPRVGRLMGSFLKPSKCLTHGLCQPQYFSVIQ